MQLPESSNALLEMLSGRQRQNYLRKGRKLVRDFSGDVFYRWYSDLSDSMYRDLEFVAKRSYQRRLGVGFRDTPALRAAWGLAASKGRLRVCILNAGGRPCAYWTGMTYGPTLWGDYMGYDSQFASYSPGAYLLLRSLGDLCDYAGHGIREIDLGSGESELKSLLSTSNAQESSVWIHPRTLRGLGLNLLTSLAFFVDQSAREFLTRGNLLAKAKRLRRTRAASSFESPSPLDT